MFKIVDPHRNRFPETYAAKVSGQFKTVRMSRSDDRPERVRFNVFVRLKRGNAALAPVIDGFPCVLGIGDGLVCQKIGTGPV
ncbi:hypothetical protein HDF14_003903 [Edaphobacter lichenicola]|uniref:Uncharacterized protein n=1 Tax=Tunturiibacter gelidiferens TaxID=3069689 RepID=A0A9X0QHF9_9BACT|nr:hypothetical protein [Edaphobacter lichenicola]MBB5330270.1 hypothetical protein [Edaphobacter lichenicola]